MNDIIVTSLLKLYGLITVANASVNELIARSFVENFLKKSFSRNTVSDQILKYDALVQEIRSHENLNIESSVLAIGELINKELPIKQKYLILIYILQFVEHWQTNPLGSHKASDSSQSIISILVKALKLDMREFEDLQHYIQDSYLQIKNKSKILVVHDNKYLQLRGVNNLLHPGLEGEFVFYHLSHLNAYLLKYKGTEKIQIHGQILFSNHIYFFEKGASVKGKGFKPLYYSMVVANYLSKLTGPNIHLQANDIEFRFPKSTNGIHRFSMEGKSGQMLGIMGGSGTGKSTLLNIFNGTILPNKGSITINGYDIHKDKEILSGTIGYIPQDDLLIEELSVYDNLYYNAKLCLGNLNASEIENIIKKVLDELDLTQIMNLKVGSSINKFISGGQRKRLNIALELIRKPYVLFVDEPTSGLSSSDSEKVMDLLKEQALSGKYLVVNIHQPSSYIYTLFDDILVLDKGGYPIYFGNPIDAIEYVKTEIGMIDAAESFCSCCNNINPEQVLHTIELQKIDDFGEFTVERKIKPEAWYQRFIEKLQPKIQTEKNKIELPATNLKLPNALKQFGVFSMRNFRSKLADKQYLVISLFVTPVLALILSFLVRHLEEDTLKNLHYNFSENENIPAYFFMSIIVALFIGLIVSAEEIYHDRKILKRESFLNLSQISYYNSKIIFLFFISAIQTLSYVLIGNSILELKGMNLSYWMVLFSLACFSNVVGLNISSAFKSAVTIYIIIPLVLVPQILLGGVIVNFDKLHNSLATKENVPLIGDFMASRWAYEAMMVTQFKENDYEKVFFDIEKQTSQSSFVMNYKIPRLLNISNDLLRAKKKQSEISASTLTDYKLLNNEISNLHNSYKYILTKEVLSPETSEKEMRALTKNLASLKIKIAKYVSTLMYQKDDMVKELGQTEIVELKEKHFNNRVAEFVLNNRDINRIKQVGSKLVQSYEPIYLFPDSKFGRSHFFSPVKVLGTVHIDTLWFNIAAIWLMTLVLYLMLIFNVLKRVIR